MKKEMDDINKFLESGDKLLEMVQKVDEEIKKGNSNYIAKIGKKEANNDRKRN